MAEYRQLKVAFWYSPFVMSLSPEERAFYAFMLTNPLTTHCGVYPLPIKMIVVIHGHTEEIIQGLIQKFVAWKKIEYDPATNEFFLVNWMKHNRPKNPMTFAHVGKEVVSIKSQELKNRWLQTNPLDAEKVGLPFTRKTINQQPPNDHETVRGQLADSIDKVSQPLSNGIETVRRQSTDCIDKVSQPLSNGIETVKNPEIAEIQKDLSSSVPGSSSDDLKKEVGCSLPGLKTGEGPEPKDQEHPQDQKRDLFQNELSLEENQPEEEQKTEPEEECNPSFPDLNLEEENFQDREKNPAPKPKQALKDPHPGSAAPPPQADPTPEAVIIRYMNQRFCTGYRLDSCNIRELIHKKLAEGFSVSDFLIVINKKLADWRDPPYRSNLVPHVLFGDKFETYLQQAPRQDKKRNDRVERMPVSGFHNHTREIVEVF